MKALRILLIVFAGLLTVSCNPKQGPIDDLKSICTELEQDSDEYTEEDWTNVEQKLEQIDNELGKYEYTEEEMAEIHKLQGKVVGLVTKKAMKSVQKGMDDAAKMFEGGMEGFMEGLGEDEE